MRILIFTDSLGLPRYTPEFCSYEDTWPILLRNKERMIHQVSIGNATSKILLKQVSYQKAFKPDLVILQVGIVDCAPRFMTSKELDITGALGNLGKGIRFLFNRKIIKRMRKISFVNKVDFKSNLLKFKSAFDCPIIAVGILPATSKYESLLPGVIEKIIIYNSILEDTFKIFIDLKDVLVLDGIMTDHHHLNAVGHRYLFENIEKIIESRIKVNV